MMSTGFHMTSPGLSFMLGRRNGLEGLSRRGCCNGIHDTLGSSPVDDHRASAP